MTALLTPFSYDFMQQALLVGTLIAVVCGTLSCFVVLKGWSLMGDAISHAILPGVVLAYVLALPLALGAFAAGLVCAIGSGFVQSNSRLKEDTALGVVFTGLFGLGLLLMSQVTSDVHLTHVLFGNILGIEAADLIQAIVAAGLTLAVLVVLRRDLVLFCFDPGHAGAIGLNVTALRYVFLVLLAASIVAGVQAVGVILVVALLITPGCIGHLLADRFGPMTAWSVGSAVLATGVGIWTSFHANVSTAGCIVLALGVQFALALVFAPRHGLLAHGRLRRAALRG
jgi:manganese transport system permease protein/manganese/iron transport system permease protein